MRPRVPDSTTEFKIVRTLNSTWTQNKFGPLGSRFYCENYKLYHLRWWNTHLRAASINEDNCKRGPLIPEPKKRMANTSISSYWCETNPVSETWLFKHWPYGICLNLFVVKCWYTRPLHWWHQLLKLTYNMNHLELLSPLIFQKHKVNITIIVSIHYSATLTYCFFNLSFLKSQEVIHLSNNAFIK